MPDSALPVPAAEDPLVRQIIEREEAQQRDRFELVRRAAAGAAPYLKLGAGIGAGIAHIMDAGVWSGSLALVGCALEAAEMLMLKEAAGRMKAADKVSDWSAAGLGTAADCARAGGRADPVMREMWLRMLMACLDKDRRGKVRLSDMELLRSMNPADSFLVLVIGRHVPDIMQEWHKSQVWLHMAPNGNAQKQKDQFPFLMVKDWAQTIFNQPLAIPDDELWWALRARTRDSSASIDEGPALFVELMQTTSLSHFLEPKNCDNAELRDHQHARLTDKMVKIGLTERARRLLDLLVDPRQGH